MHKFLSSLLLGGYWLQAASANAAASHQLRDYGIEITRRQAQPAPGQLNTFQVSEPILTPQGPSNQYGCVYTTTLMEYNFANSYGNPFVGKYTPPPCKFNRVTMNLTVTSKGRQFDRLAIMYLGDVEVFRTSTAEPTQNGIIWNYVKEMHMYNALWRQPQTIIYDEGNIVDGTYTGLFNTTLTATFFTVPDSPVTADTILPISTRQGASGKGSVFSLPDQTASVAYTFPPNVNRAVISLSATGQINEEFWYSNVPASRADTFANTTGELIGGGTFREVQLYIDGHLSGVSWPFPIIFTGGIVPGLWRPIVGIDAFDLQQHEIDITPWLGYLLDGRSHTFSIAIASVADNGGSSATLTGTPSYWLVSGTIFLFQDATGFRTQGTFPLIETPPIRLSTSSSVTKDSSGQNDTLTYSTQASRSVFILSSITTANGTREVSWSQQLTYSNANKLTSRGLVQYTQQRTTGLDASIGNAAAGLVVFSKSYDYPLTVNSSYLSTASSLTLEATLQRSKHEEILGNPVFPTGLQNLNSTESSTPTVFLVVPGSSDNNAGTSSSNSQSQLMSLPANYLQKAQIPTSFQGTVVDTSQTGSATYFSSHNGSYSFGTTEQYFTLAGVQSNNNAGNTELYSRHVKAVNSSIVLDQQELLGRAFSVPFTTRIQSDDNLNGLGVAGDFTGGVRRTLGRGPGNRVD